MSFWIWDDNGYSWYQRRFQGRRARKGKEKVEKEKEDQDDDFSDQNKGQGKRKGKSHLPQDESYWPQDEWQGNETENWNEGYWA